MPLFLVSLEGERDFFLLNILASEGAAGAATAIGATWDAEADEQGKQILLEIKNSPLEGASD